MAFPILGKICFPWVRGWEWKCIFLRTAEIMSVKIFFKLSCFLLFLDIILNQSHLHCVTVPNFRGTHQPWDAALPTAAVFPTPTPCNYVSYQVTVSSCDLLVVSVGQMSMSRAINLTQKLWTAGITAEIMYDWSQVRDRKL